MLKNKLILTATVLSSAFLTGCMSSNVKVADTRPVSVPEAPLAPSASTLKAQMTGDGQKIIISPVEYHSKHESSAASEAYDDLQQRLMKSGNTVVDRELAKKLQDELLAAEKSGKFRTSGPAIADVAIMPKIVGLTFGRSFTKAKYWTDKDGKSHRNDPYCSFSGNAKLHVRAYKVPSMELINTYEYEGSVRNRTETSNSNCPISEGGILGLYSGAVADAVKSGSFQTINDLAPESYVIERRDDIEDPSQSLFRVTINKKHGAMEGATVKFFRKEERITPITNEKRIENVYLGEGEVINAIDKSGSYVLVDDEQLITNLRIGDVAKLDHGKCDFDENEILGSCIKIPKIF